MSGHIATASIDVTAGPERVWAALTEPEQIAVYMQGSRVTTTWEVGTPITWDGEYDERAYQDKGEVLTYDEPHVLSVTHYSPMMGQPDEPENYHTLVYTLTADGSGTHLELTQDGNDSEEQAEQFSQNWQSMLDGLKAHLEA
ncbi:MAG TPA: SRPBCC domain-containing protein [Nocardioides sp.]|uniref:SRPBCC domain-containing protein n=1 Tax=uncultured Nocardioides sp. TaxID=198441 RepID=UPI000EC5F1A5|nr:SRPBCC domain-containing protein [uncultured Nocardioides sp.]HCB06904.1 ATPase [Nocardioides sp.]HRD63697.1 SRPBCC domain-containing protein [Nocardioides sp.]HRI97151.1 SRPBCC domain-containing protein [Nocardioides sp.]HRK46629.1 SRPBCC domain-containing protein [Nocardioides sp.]